MATREGREAGVRQQHAAQAKSAPPPPPQRAVLPATPPRAAPAAPFPLASAPSNPLWVGTIKRRSVGGRGGQAPAAGAADTRAYGCILTNAARGRLAWGNPLACLPLPARNTGPPPPPPPPPTPGPGPAPPGQPPRPSPNRHLQLASGDLIVLSVCHARVGIGQARVVLHSSHAALRVGGARGRRRRAWRRGAAGHGRRRGQRRRHEGAGAPVQHWVTAGHGCADVGRQEGDFYAAADPVHLEGRGGAAAIGAV